MLAVVRAVVACVAVLPRHLLPRGDTAVTPGEGFQWCGELAHGGGGVIGVDEGVVGAGDQDVEVFETGCCEWHGRCDGQEARDAEELSEMHFIDSKAC